MIRIGLGQDSHWFAKKKKPLILGGIKISNSGGLKANSDGDVILHSLCNALASAIGADSLGTWADEMFFKQKITDSQQFIKKIFKRVEAKNFRVINVSVVIEAKKPKISLKNLQKMKKTISRLLKINHSAVGITITSGEGITPFGQGKAIQALSIALLEKNK